MPTEISAHSRESPPLSDKIRRWMRPPRRLTMTTAGKFFVLLTFAVGFGAVNTGNNLLFLLMGMLLALITVSGILSEAVLRKITVSRKLPNRIIAEDEMACDYVVQNHADYAALSLELADLEATPIAGPLTRVGTQKLGLKRHPWWKIWKKSQTEGRPIASAYAVRVESGANLVVPGTMRFDHRGHYQLDRVAALTRFPFGLFEKSREWDAPIQILVEPAPLKHDAWQGALWARMGEVDTHKEGPGEEFFGLREFREGEDARGVHWKSSARRGTLMVRETERRHHRRVVIHVLDRAQNLSEDDFARFELGIRRTAGLVGALRSAGFTLGEGPDDADHLMRRLATISLEAGIPILPDSNDDSTRIIVGLNKSLELIASGPDDLVLPFEGAKE